jgi:hypothetical protein
MNRLCPKPLLRGKGMEFIYLTHFECQTTFSLWDCAFGNPETVRQMANFQLMLCEKTIAPPLRSQPSNF